MHTFNVLEIVLLAVEPVHLIHFGVSPQLLLEYEEHLTKLCFRAQS